MLPTLHLSPPAAPPAPVRFVGAFGVRCLVTTVSDIFFQVVN